MLSGAALILATLVPLQSSAEDPSPGPSSFAIEFPRGESLFRGVSLSLSITALDASGRRLASFDGHAAITGAVSFSSKEPVTRVGPFESGLFLLEGVEIPSGAVAVETESGRGETRFDLLPGFLTLLPPLLAILLALATRQVLLALFCGVWSGALLAQDLDPFLALLRSADTYLVGALADRDHAHILLFSLTLAGMVGILTATGGIRGIVELISSFARSPRSGQLGTWALGMLIFFDDYANALLVGNTMRPFTDRLRISREKLSFIVDATSAPVATVGIISTWTAYQIGLIGDVLPHTAATTREPYLFFLHSIPYSLYSILMLALVFSSALALRDFGAMRRAEERCRRTGAVLRPGAQPLVDDSLAPAGDTREVQPRWYNAAVPIACVVGFTVLGLYSTGVTGLAEQTVRSPQEVWDRWRSLLAECSPLAWLRAVIGHSDAYRALLWAALGASVVAGILGLAHGHRMSRVVSSWISGVRSLVLAVMILVLAWSISAVCRDVKTGDYVVSMTRDLLSPTLVPALTFLAAGLIAFATGTSYGTMGILIPILLPLSFKLSTAAGLDAVLIDRLGYATLAAILSGAVFGDHCSPISDTTVLSSMACGADHIDHVRTQLPYAALVAAICVPGYLLVGLDVPLAVVLGLGAGGLLLAFHFLSSPVEGPPSRRT